MPNGPGANCSRCIKRDWFDRSTADAPPFHLRGNYAPVRDELTASDLPVQGTIRRELRMCYDAMLAALRA